MQIHATLSLHYAEGCKVDCAVLLDCCGTHSILEGSDGLQSKPQQSKAEQYVCFLTVRLGFS